MREAIRFFALQYLVCVTVTWNTRAIARADVCHTVGSDVVFSLINFGVIKKIADSDRSMWAMAGYTAGNILGSLTTIFVTRWIWGS